MTEGFVAFPATAVCPGSGTGVKQTHLPQQNKVTHQQVRRRRCVIKCLLSATWSLRGRRGAGRRRHLKFLKTMEHGKVRCQERQRRGRTIGDKRGGIWGLSKQVAALSLPQAIKGPLSEHFLFGQRWETDSSRQRETVKDDANSSEGG